MNKNNTATKMTVTHPADMVVPDRFINLGRTKAARLDSKKKLGTATKIATMFRVMANRLFFFRLISPDRTYPSGNVFVELFILISPSLLVRIE
jgi:hypothetical protein